MRKVLQTILFTSIGVTTGIFFGCIVQTPPQSPQGNALQADGTYGGQYYGSAASIIASTAGDQPAAISVTVVTLAIPPGQTAEQAFDSQPWGEDSATYKHVAGAQVLLSGTASASATTDASGSVLFQPVSSGRYTITVTYAGNSYVIPCVPVASPDFMGAPATTVKIYVNPTETGTVTARSVLAPIFQNDCT